MTSHLLRRLAPVLLLFPAAFAAHAQVADLLISEYIEGSGTNKAVEIYNGTGAAVDLAGGQYRLELYSNGSTSITSSVALTGSIADGDVLVLCNATDTGITSRCDTSSTGTINFNGDDALVLRRNSTGAGIGDIVDAFGQVGFDPGSEWGSGDQSTADNTLRRKPSVCAGDTNPADAFDPASQWDGFANGTFDGLGSHTASCGGSGQPALSIGNASAAEGDSGTKPFFFTITSNRAAPAGGISVDYATADGTATVANGDYAAKNGTATIVEGATSVTIGIDVNGDTATEANETFSVVLSNPSGAVIGVGTATGTISNDDVAIVPIHDIQGNGDVSPLVGQTVSTRGIVTGRKGNGFFLQAADADADADPATSEGVYVFTSSAPPAEAAVGNLVQVTATVSEFSPSQDPLQPPLTELGFATVVVLSTGNALPAPVPLTASFPDPEGAYDQLERVEAMRVSAASLSVVSPTGGTTNEANATGASNGVFFATVTGLPRPFRTPGIQAPDPAPSGSIPPIPRWDTAPETLQVDSDAIGANKLDLAVGAVVTDVVGPLDYGFRRYTILPEATPAVAAGNAIVAARLPGADEFTVATYNLQRFFDTVNDPAIGEPVLTADAFANRLNKASLGIRNQLHAPDVLAVMEMENLATLQALAQKIGEDAIAAGEADPRYAAYLQEGNDVGGIDVGFLVKAATVAGSTPRIEVVDVTQFGKDTTWIDPSDGQPALLNDRPPLLLRAIAHYADGRSFPVSVLAVHQRSFNGISDETASGSTTAGDRVRRKRQAQAEYLANLVQARQDADPTEGLVVLGDFNAFDVNDGYVDPMGVVAGLPTPDEQTVVPGDGVDLVDPDLLDLHYAQDADQRYSYVFDGQAQSLDHIVINQALGTEVNAYAADHARMNADFPETNRNDANSPSRLSDHDPVIAYFAVPTIEKADLDMVANATPSPTSEGRPVEFTGTVTNHGPNDATNPGVGFAFGHGLPDLQVSGIPDGWTCSTPQVTRRTTTLACNALSLAADASATFTLKATAAANPIPGALTMAAAATAETDDPEASNNNAHAQVVVVRRQADMSTKVVRIRNSPDGTLNFRVAVANAGPDAAEGGIVHILGKNPGGDVTITTPSGWTCQRLGGGAVNITCNRTSAMPAHSAQTIGFTLVGPARDGLEITASIGSGSNDPNLDNNVSVYSKP